MLCNLLRFFLTEFLFTIRNCTFLIRNVNLRVYFDIFLYNTLNVELVTNGKVKIKRHKNGEQSAYNHLKSVQKKNIQLKRARNSSKS